MKTSLSWTALAVAAVTGWSLATGGQAACGQQPEQPAAAEAPANPAQAGTEAAKPQQSGQQDAQKSAQQDQQQNQPRSGQRQSEQAGQSQTEQQKSEQQKSEQAQKGSQESSKQQQAQDQQAQDQQGQRQKREMLGVKFDTSNEESLKVTEIEQESAAAQAGLQKGDTIVEVGGREVENPAQFNSFINGFDGNEVPIVVMRDGQRQTVQMRVRQGDQAERSDREQISQSRQGERGQRAGLGVTLDGQRQGVWIKQVMPESPAAQAGLRAGDQIVTIDGRQFRDAHRAAAAIRQMQPGQQVRIGVRRDGETQQLQAHLDTRTSAFAQADQLQPPRPMQAERGGQRQTVLRPDVDSIEQMNRMQQQLRQLQQEVQSLRSTVAALRQQLQSGGGAEAQATPGQPLDDQKRAPDAGAIIDGAPGEQPEADGAESTNRPSTPPSSSRPDDQSAPQGSRQGI